MPVLASYLLWTYVIYPYVFTPREGVRSSPHPSLQTGLYRFVGGVWARAQPQPSSTLLTPRDSM